VRKKGTTGRRKEYMRRCMIRRRKKRENNKGNRGNKDRRESLRVNKQEREGKG